VKTQKHTQSLADPTPLYYGSNPREYVCTILLYGYRLHLRVLTVGNMLSYLGVIQTFDSRSNIVLGIETGTNSCNCLYCSNIFNIISYLFIITQKVTHSWLYQDSCGWFFVPILIYETLQFTILTPLTLTNHTQSFINNYKY